MTSLVLSGNHQLQLLILQLEEADTVFKQPCHEVPLHLQHERAQDRPGTMLLETLQAEHGQHGMAGVHLHHHGVPLLGVLGTHLHQVQEIIEAVIHHRAVGQSLDNSR
jgi:hypothetical protein